MFFVTGETVLLQYVNLTLAVSNAVSTPIFSICDHIEHGIQPMENQLVLFTLVM